jgi:hypothetical protein
LNDPRSILRHAREQLAIDSSAGDDRHEGNGQRRIDAKGDQHGLESRLLHRPRDTDWYISHHQPRYRLGAAWGPTTRAAWGPITGAPAGTSGSATAGSTAATTAGSTATTLRTGAAAAPAGGAEAKEIAG